MIRYRLRRVKLSKKKHKSKPRLKSRSILPPALVQVERNYLNSDLGCSIKYETEELKEKCEGELVSLEEHIKLKRSIEINLGWLWLVPLVIDFMLLIWFHSYMSSSDIGAMIMLVFYFIFMFIVFVVSDRCEVKPFIEVTKYIKRHEYKSKPFIVKSPDELGSGLDNLLEDKK